MAQETDVRPSNSADPVIVDLGKKKKKAIKRLRRGQGRLMEQVEDCIQELRDAGAISGTAQPVIVVVREKQTGPRWF
jgi:hypothetical protein